MRIKWIDVAKGIGILLVTVGHTNARHLLGGYVGNWINCFHMPLFFVMAGLCFDPRRHPRFGGYLLRKLSALGWPYLALSFFMALLSVFLYWGNDPRFSFLSQIVGILRGQSCVNTFWFIVVLFQVEIIYWLVARAARTRSAAAAAAVAIGCIVLFLIPHGWKPFQWNTTLASLGFYGLGAFARDLLAVADDRIPYGKLAIIGGGGWFCILWRYITCSRVQSGGILSKSGIHICSFRFRSWLSALFRPCQWCSKRFHA